MKLRFATKFLASIFIASSSDTAAALGTEKNLRGLNGNGSSSGAGGNSNNGNGNSSDNQVIVIVQLTKDKTKGPTSRCHEKAKANGGSVVSVYEKALNGCAIKVNENQVDKMKHDVDFEVVEKDQVVHASGCTVEGDGSCTVSTPTWGLNRVDQCHLPLSNTPFQKLPAENVRVYILDTGVRLTHEEFDGGMVGPDDGTCHWTAYSNEGYTDGDGHGTHVAGTVVGNTYGVAYCDDSIVCSLCSVKVLSNNGGGTTQGVISGIEHVMNNCPSDLACVANMSLGGSFSSSLNQAVNNAVAAGVTMVVAAGNESTDACSKSPASAALAITTGSTTATDSSSGFSNYGSCVDIWAPGSSITSAWSTSNTATNTISGTSMASPHAAGIAAIIQGASPTKLTPAEVQEAMESNSKLLSDYQGYARKLTTTVGGCNGPTAPPTPAPTLAPCQSGYKFMKVAILTDNYPGETTWAVTNTCTGATEMSGGSYPSSGTTYETKKCLPEVGAEFVFTINDAFGDGICCGYGSGNYEVTFGNQILAEGGAFGSTETVTLYGSCNTTPNPSPQPTAPVPTNAPTPLPTAAPVTPAPTPNPTSPPTQAPVPPTSSPTPAPSPQPTPPPTSAPVVSVAKYRCTKWEPEATSICTEGSLAGAGAYGDKCSTEGVGSSCGNGGKVCWWASCPDTGGGPGPSPTPPPTPPTGGCPICSATGEACCDNCIDNGKPSNRGCFPL